MNRRTFLNQATAAVASAPLVSSVSGVEPAAPFRRVRPTDPSWPNEARWEALRQQVGGRLIKLESPLELCRKQPDSPACEEFFRKLRNPYYIGDEPALTQTSGWVGAWTSSPSVYAVAARETADIVSAVNFARENRLRLVVKGGGHSYKGTSNSADSLLVWTRAMNKIVLHENFIAEGCSGIQAPQPAVTVGAGTIWNQAYQVVTTRAGRYVQGGGCTTVGVAGLIQSGGFGSFSKNYGLAAAGLLEVEVVTADGVVRIANACQHPDLFWGLKGGGGGSLGVVTKLTLRTRELPELFGGVFGTIKAKSDEAFRKLAARVVRFYHESLFNRHWGEQIIFGKGNSVRISMVFQGLKPGEAENIWRPFLDWVRSAPDDFVLETPPLIAAIPARHMWDPDYLRANLPQFIGSDDRPGASASNIFWAGDGREAGQVLHAYRSAWLPARLLDPNHQGDLVEALIASSRHWGASLHFNKGLAGAPQDVLTAARDTATNPATLDAFALAIIASNGPPAFPGVAGHEPDINSARRNAQGVNAAMNELLRLAGENGSYVSESDFFERSWQQSFWGSNYPKLAAIKKKYDPDGLFFVHQGVGSEEWSPDGFERLKQSL